MAYKVKSILLCFPKMCDKMRAGGERMRPFRAKDCRKLRGAAEKYEIDIIRRT